MTDAARLVVEHQTCTDEAVAHRVEGTGTIKTDDTTENNASASGTGVGTSTMVVLLLRHRYHP